MSPMDDDAPATAPEAIAPRRSWPRRLLGWARRGALALLLVLALLALAGFAWERMALADFESEFPPTGELVELADGRRLHVRVQGRGEPTVVFESGLGGNCTEWEPLAADLAKTTRVVTYDRAGLGWSDPSSAPSDARAVVDDLAQALERSGVDGPLVLVGHSVGGLYVRHYRDTHPDDVAGLVLIDSSHEEQLERMPAVMREGLELQRTVMAVAAALAHVGAPRALAHSGLVPFLEDETDGGRWVALMVRHASLAAMVAEIEALPESARQVQASARPLGDLPLVVLTADALEDPAAEMPEDLAEVYPEVRALWLELQAELAALSSRSVHEIVPGAGHYVQATHADVVLRHVRAVLETVRGGG